MKIKVLHITKMNGVSGSENHLRTLLAGLDKNRFEVALCILTEAPYRSLLEEYTTQLEQAGVAVSILIMGRYGDLGLLRMLRRSIVRGRFHIVHTHLIHADVWGTLAAKLAGGVQLVSSRHNDDHFRNYRLLIWLNRFLAHWHSRVIVISDWVGRFLEDVEGIPSKKIVRIHYGLHPESITPRENPSYLRQEFQIPEHAPVIGTIGRLTAQKGHAYLLQAVQQIVPHFPELRVLMIGDGELRSELEQQARTLGIEANMLFVGYRNDAIELLSGVDFFVFPSLWEGFGLVLLEAMALKKAVVASHVSAIPESVLDGETGLLIPPKDAPQLAEAMLALLRDPGRAQAMGMCGYQRLQDYFTVEKMVAQTSALYLDVLENSGERR